jgi:hypothetical protein
VAGSIPFPLLGFPIVHHLPSGWLGIQLGHDGQELARARANHLDGEEGCALATVAQSGRDPVDGQMDPLRDTLVRRPSPVPLEELDLQMV